MTIAEDAEWNKLMAECPFGGVNFLKPRSIDTCLPEIYDAIENHDYWIFIHSSDSEENAKFVGYLMSKYYTSNDKNASKDFTVMPIGPAVVVYMAKKSKMSKAQISLSAGEIGYDNTSLSKFIKDPNLIDENPNQDIFVLYNVVNSLKTDAIDDFEEEGNIAVNITTHEIIKYMAKQKGATTKEISKVSEAFLDKNISKFNELQNLKDDIKQDKKNEGSHWSGTFLDDDLR